MTIFVCTSNSGKLREFQDYLTAATYTLGTKVVGVRQLSEVSGVRYDDPKEPSDLFTVNAAIKIFAAARFAKGVIDKAPQQKVKTLLVDDSGLCVPRLNYRPGVHSATFGGHPRGDERNRRALKEEMQKANGWANVPSKELRMDAFFVCFLVSAQQESLMTNTELLSLPADKFEEKLHSVLAPVERAFLDKAAKECENREEGGNESRTVSLPGGGEITIDFGFCSGEVSTVEQNLIPNAGHGYDCMFYPVESPELSFASMPLEDKNMLSHRAWALRSFVTKLTSRGKS